MKVTEEVDLRDFEAWSEAKNVLEKLIETGHVDDMQAVIEEMWPDGVDATQLNDYLWFEAEDDWPGWFFDYSDMEEIEDQVEELNEAKDPRGRKPFFEADGGEVYYLETEREDDDDPKETPKLKLQAVSYVTTNADSKVGDIVEIDYDFSDSFNDNLERLKKELDNEGILPALPTDCEYVKGFPVWAIAYLTNDDPSGISDEDKKLVDEWMEENGYSGLEDVLENTHNESDPYPVFGLGCETQTVVMWKKKEDSNV